MSLELCDLILKVPAIYLGQKTIHHIRHPDMDESMEFKRRFSELRTHGNRIRSDNQIEAVNWYYNKLAQRVEGLTWKGQDLMDAFPDGDWKKRVPFEIKDVVVGYLRAQVDLEEEEEKNS